MDRGGQRVARSGETSTPVLLKRNLSIQVLATACPLTCGGENSQRSAAFTARFAKYLLGPAEASFADVTLPDESASTRTPTLMVPVIVFSALFGTSGKTRRATSPLESLAGFAVENGTGSDSGARAAPAVVPVAWTFVAGFAAPL